MTATKRIPVTEETWRELGKEKEPGQTWDDLLEEIYVQARKKKMAEKVDKAREGNLDTVALDDV